LNLALEDVHASIVEHGVGAERQTMSAEKVFWSHFCTNLAPVTWVLGALVIGIGLDFRTGLLALVIGNVLGALPVGLNATIGPRTGLTQIEISRFAFGRIGTRLPATLNWISAVGWDAVNNVPSVLAILALATSFGFALPFWVGLSALVAVQLTASIYGHHVVQLLAKYVCYVLIVVFAVTGIVAVLAGGSLVAARGPITPAMFLLGVSMIAGFNIGFAPYSSDYTRYLPSTTKPRTIFALSFGGLVSSGFAMELCGLLTASRLHDLSAAGVIAGIGALTGPFGPIALLAIAISAIAINSINDNTAAYSLISTGVRIRDRHVTVRFRARRRRRRQICRALLELSAFVALLDRAVGRYRARRLVSVSRCTSRARVGHGRGDLRDRYATNDPAFLGNGDLHGADCEDARGRRYRLFRRILHRVARLRRRRTAPLATHSGSELATDRFGERCAFSKAVQHREREGRSLQRVGVLRNLLTEAAIDDASVRRGEPLIVHARQVRPG
jgi:purine-cytosine permease-like protein